MFPGILRLEDFNLGNIKFKNEDEITIKLKDLKVLLERNSNAFKELEEILFAPNNKITFTTVLNKPTAVE